MKASLEETFDGNYFLRNMVNFKIERFYELINCFLLKEGGRLIFSNKGIWLILFDYSFNFVTKYIKHLEKTI